ncbi:Hpt domain-containing protein [candidate division KSB1 bacterium]|nr:Hpt domain-containing protein [candidate division KSB1 bacterium]
MQDEAFFKELLTIFKGECREHVQTMTQGLDDLEQNMNSEKQIEIAEVVHRSAHSLKGAARTIGLVDVEPICQSLETTFGIFMRQKLTIPSEIFNKFHTAVKLLSVLLESINSEGKTEGEKSELMRIVEEISSQMVQYRK